MWRGEVGGVGSDGDAYGTLPLGQGQDGERGGQQGKGGPLDDW